MRTRITFAATVTILALLLPTTSADPSPFFSTLRSLPDGTPITVPTGISADGTVVVGRDFNFEPGEKSLAWIWDDAHGKRPFDEVIETTAGLDLSDWRIRSANGISADGQTIIGYALDPDDQRVGFVTGIPELTAAAFALFLVACAAAQRRG